MINLKVKNAFRLNWQQVTKEAKDYRDSVLNNPKMTLEEKLKAIELEQEINLTYKADDIDGYWKILDENRALLKGVM